MAGGVVVPLLVRVMLRVRTLLLLLLVLLVLRWCGWMMRMRIAGLSARIVVLRRHGSAAGSRMHLRVRRGVGRRLRVGRLGSVNGTVAAVLSHRTVAVWHVGRLCVESRRIRTR